MDDFWLAPLDLYCERTDASWLSEPLNFISNFVFYLAAWAMFRAAKNSPDAQQRRELSLLAFLALLVGSGSALFHSFATRLTQILDVLPIAIFVFFSVVFYFRQRAKEGAPLPKLLSLTFLTLLGPPLLAFGTELHSLMNKGDAYLGIAPTLVLFGFLDSNSSRRKKLFGAAFIFALALFFRTLDPRICDIFPYGTHFLWHLLTTACAYLMAIALADSSIQEETPMARGEK